MSRPSKELKSEYVTIAELSKIVGKSNQSIYKKMRQKPSFNSYIRVFDGKKYVHKSAIWEEFGVEVEGFMPDDKSGLKNLRSGDPLISALTDQVNSQKQQIEALQRTIDNLSETLKAEQLLHGQTAARLQQATLLIEELRKQPEQPKQTADPERSEQAEKTADPEQSAQPDGSPHQAQDQSDQEQPHHDNGSGDQAQENHDNGSSDQGQEQPERLTFLQRLKRFLGL